MHATELLSVSIEANCVIARKNLPHTILEAFLNDLQPAQNTVAADHQLRRTDLRADCGKGLFQVLDKVQYPAPTMAKAEEPLPPSLPTSH